MALVWVCMVEKISLEVLSQRVQVVVPKLRLRAGWGVNELIKEHALDSDAPKAGNSFF